MKSRLLCLVFAAVSCVACSHVTPPSAASAVRVGSYTAVLQACYDSTTNYAAYDTCAKKADQDFGKKTP